MGYHPTFPVRSRCGVIAIVVGYFAFVSPDDTCPANNSALNGLIVYATTDFDSNVGGFEGANGGEVHLTEDSVAGTALRCRPNKHWGGTSLAIDIQGSEDLKIAFLGKGTDWSRAAVNVFDKLADDNTTTYAPRKLVPDTWTPVIYYLEDFRYNSQRDGTVDADTHYASFRLYFIKKFGLDCDPPPSGLLEQELATLRDDWSWRMRKP